MNPTDLESLSNVIELDLVEAFATETYQKEIIDNSARVLRNVPIEVHVIDDPDVPTGRYRLRQRRLQSQVDPVPSLTLIDDVGPSTGRIEEKRDTMITGEDVLYEAAGTPLLRLITGNQVAETRRSPARAAGSRSAELALPNEMTISRIHARFNCGWAYAIIVSRPATGSESIASRCGSLWHDTLHLAHAAADAEDHRKPGRPHPR